MRTQSLYELSINLLKKMKFKRLRKGGYKVRHDLFIDYRGEEICAYFKIDKNSWSFNVGIYLMLCGDCGGENSNFTYKKLDSSNFADLINILNGIIDINKYYLKSVIKNIE